MGVLMNPVQSAKFFYRCALRVALCTLLTGTMPGLLIAQTRDAKKPAKIVSVNVCTDELLLQLVPPERIAALTRLSEDPSISTIAEQARGIKRIQGGVEDVLACNADLLVGGRFSNKETLRFFQRSEVPVLTFGIPKSFEDIYTDIRNLAEAVGEPRKGETIIKQMQKELGELKPKTTPDVGQVKHPVLRGPKRAVFFQSGNYVPGAGTFENAIMEAAGLINVASELGIKDYGNLPLEQLVRTKPDLLIFASDQKAGHTVRGEVLSHPVIRKALPEAKVVTIPSSLLNCGSPASVEAVRILVKEVSA